MVAILECIKKTTVAIWGWHNIHINDFGVLATKGFYYIHGSDLGWHNIHGSDLGLLKHTLYQFGVVILYTVAI
jgi:hypothetical protein